MWVQCAGHVVVVLETITLNISATAQPVRGGALMQDSGVTRSKSDLRARLLDARAHNRQTSAPGEESASEAFRRLLAEHIVRSTPSGATVCAYLPTAGE